MTMRVTALAALAGSLFFVPVIMGQANAGVPDLKGAFGTTQSDVTLGWSRRPWWRWHGG
jgi:hypothetical protein